MIAQVAKKKNTDKPSNEPQWLDKAESDDQKKNRFKLLGTNVGEGLQQAIAVKHDGLELSPAANIANNNIATLEPGVDSEAK